LQPNGDHQIKGAEELFDLVAEEHNQKWKRDVRPSIELSGLPHRSPNQMPHNHIPGPPPEMRPRSHQLEFQSSSGCRLQGDEMENGDEKLPLSDQHEENAHKEQGQKCFD
jgi:hypothetical protein